MWHQKIQFETLRSGGGTRMEAALFLPESRESVFAFFSDAFQLEQLTPSWLHFRIMSVHPMQLKQGTLIDYRLQLRCVPMRWQSRIDAWEPPQRFVDVQTHGPYRHWRHEHLFEEAPGGTICRDIVDYEVPGGRLIERLFVRPDVARIFKFRQRRLQQLFGATAASLPVADKRPVCDLS